MQEYARPSRPPIRRGPFFEIALLVIFVAGGLLIGNFIGLIAGMLLAGGDVSAFQNIINNATDHPKAQLILLVVQAAAALFAFVLAPWLYLRIIEQRSLQALSPNSNFWIMPALLTVLLVIAFMPFNALLIEWNRNVDLPGIFDKWENWAKTKESTLEELTKRLTEFSSIPQLLAGLIVIALIPAVGEELVFRGLIQPKVHKLLGNIHAAVWITGFLFSFIHFQFYGLIPRMLLGVLFGYLYAWSGNLWYPVLGHFINNGFTLVMFYLHQHQSVNIDIEDTASIPWSTSLAFMTVSGFLLYSLKMYFDKNRAPVA